MAEVGLDARKADADDEHIEARHEHGDRNDGQDFFDAADHPTATFTGRAAGWQGTRGTLAGDLTIRGITRPVNLAAEYLGHAADPWGGQRAIFTAQGTLNREDWGLTWNMPLDGGGLLVSKEIRIEIDAEAVLQSTAPPA